GSTARPRPHPMAGMRPRSLLAGFGGGRGAPAAAAVGRGRGARTGRGARAAAWCAIAADGAQHLALNAAQRALGAGRRGRSAGSGCLRELALQAAVLLDQLLYALAQALDQVGAAQPPTAGGSGSSGRCTARAPAPTWSRSLLAGRAIDLLN